MNTPYIKKYDEFGIVINPIVGKYTNESDTRQTRRLPKQKKTVLW